MLTSIKIGFNYIYKNVTMRSQDQGKIRFFWNVGKPFIHAGKGYVPLIKVGNIGEGFFTRNEGVLLQSDNILYERDPDKITWQTLPDGDIGLRTPAGGGPIAAEQSYVVLSEGSFYVVYRSIDGHPVFSYSHNHGHSWDPPQYKRYTDGRLIKHPRAANFIFKCKNGKHRQFSWGRLNPNMRHANGSKLVKKIEKSVTF